MLMVMTMTFFSELMDVAFAGPNVLWSICLGLCLIYWLFVILGALDLEAFDFDLDLDGDIDVDADVDVSGGGSPGLLIGIFKFLNLDSVPFMVFFSFFSLAAWTIGIMASTYISSDLLTSLAIFIPNIFLSLIISKYITAPLAPVFKNLNDVATELDLTGEEATVVHGFDKGELSQAQILRNGENLLVNIRVSGESSQESFKKGEVVRLGHKKQHESQIWYDITTSETMDL